MTKKMYTLNKLLDLLIQQDRKRAGLLVEAKVLLSSAFIASNTLGVDTTEQLLFALGILVFVLLVVSLTFKALTTYAQTALYPDARIQHR